MFHLFDGVSRLKHEKINCITAIYTSLLSMIFCMICLAGTSWAWFAANQTTDVASIESGIYRIQDMEVQKLGSSQNNVEHDGLTEEETGSVSGDRIRVTMEQSGHAYTFRAEEHQQYDINITIEGDASGYIMVQTSDGTTWYTQESKPQFHILLDKDQAGSIMIGASWGTPNSGIMLIDEESFEEVDYFSNGDVLGNGKLCSCVISAQDCEQCDLCSEDESYCSGEPPKCSCAEKCTEENVNNGCFVCSVDLMDCEGKEMPICICEIKCKELNEACPVCKTDISCCEGEEVEVKLESVSSTENTEEAENDELESETNPTETEEVSDETSAQMTNESLSITQPTDATESAAADDPAEDETDPSESSVDAAQDSVETDAVPSEQAALVEEVQDLIPEQEESQSE